MSKIKRNNDGHNARYEYWNWSGVPVNVSLDDGSGGGMK